MILPPVKKNWHPKKIFFLVASFFATFLVSYFFINSQLVEASMPQIPDDPHVDAVVAAPRAIIASGRGRRRTPGVKNKQKRRSKCKLII